MVDTSAISATQAYSRTMANNAGEKISGARVGVDEVVNGQSFAEMLAEAGGSAIEKGVASEQVSLDATTGTAGLADIVTAVSNAEATLEPKCGMLRRIKQSPRSERRGKSLPRRFTQVANGSRWVLWTEPSNLRHSAIRVKKE